MSDCTINGRVNRRNTNTDAAARDTLEYRVLQRSYIAGMMRAAPREQNAMPRIFFVKTLKMLMLLS